MTIFVTSDLHFNHDNIRKFCPNTRGQFTDKETMNANMIREWNRIVTADDLVYIIGDVALKTSGFNAATILNSLNGDKILIVGNHDKKLLKDIHFQECFKSIHDILEIHHNGYFITLCHYPLLSWNGSSYGSLHFHGHLHQHLSGMEHKRVFNVGYDSTGKIVTPIDEAIATTLHNSVTDHHTDNTTRIVCAAIKHNDIIICGIRHFDQIMSNIIENNTVLQSIEKWDQGFIDNTGAFLSREQALGVAINSNQYDRNSTTHPTKLFSENIY